MMDMVEKDNESQIIAELPGLDESDIDLSVAGDVLTIKGEKREQKEEERQGSYYLSERRFGTFRRSLHLPEGVDRDKIAARFKNGVLTITLPKTAEAVRREKKIPIST